VPHCSMRSLWRKLCQEEGAELTYETFARWVRKVKDEAIERGYLVIRRNKWRDTYIIKNPEGLLKLMYEKGFAF